MINRIDAELMSVSLGETAMTPPGGSASEGASPEGAGSMAEWLINEAGAEDALSRQFFSDLARVAGALKNRELRTRVSGRSHAQFTELNEARDHAIGELKAKVLEVKLASEDVTTATAMMGEALDMPERERTDSRDRLCEAFERTAQCSAETSELVETIAELGVRTDALAVRAGEQSARAVRLSRGLGFLAEGLCQLALRSAGTAHDAAKLTEESVESAFRSGALGASVREYLTAIDDRVHRFRELSEEWPAR